jgi:hypothetical protein
VSSRGSLRCDVTVDVSVLWNCICRNILACHQYISAYILIVYAGIYLHVINIYLCKDTGFPYGCADAAAADGRRGRNGYEVNLWLCSFARGKPRLGGLSVEKTFERQVAANEASKDRAAENRRRRKADKA